MIKFLEENTEEKFSDLGVGKGFLDKIVKVLISTFEKIAQFDPIKI